LIYKNFYEVLGLHPMHKLTRRKFLSAVVGTAAAVEVGTRLGWLPEPRIVAHAASFPSVVAASGTKDDSAEAILRSALENLGGIGRFVKPGQTVAIKPNATWAFPPGTASSTDPAVLAALVKIVQEAGAGRIIVMDHCSIEPGAAESLRVNGIGKMVKSLGVEALFPDRFSGPKELYTKVDLPNGKAFQSLGVIKAALEVDVRINLAIAKTHNVTRMTMSMKHMMGFLENPGSLHSKLMQGIVDINGESPFRADLHILEAIRVRIPWGEYQMCAGPETDITNPKVVKRMNQIVAGIDPVLIDAYGSRTFYAYEPTELPYVKLAADAGLGELDLDKATSMGQLQAVVVGQTPAPVKPTQQASQTAIPAITITSPAPAAFVTATPQPTAVEEAGLAPAPAAAASSDSTGPDVVDPNPFLSGAMIPAAAIVTGIGLAAWHRLIKLDEKDAHDQPKE
jgi:uncharacterized protein (DUF362 family)